MGLPEILNTLPKETREELLKHITTPLPSPMPIALTFSYDKLILEELREIKKLLKEIKGKL